MGRILISTQRKGCFPLGEESVEYSSESPARTTVGIDMSVDDLSIEFQQFTTDQVPAVAFSAFQNPPFGIGEAFEAIKSQAETQLNAVRNEALSVATNTFSLQV